MIRIEFDGLENEEALDAAVEEAIDQYFDSLSEEAAYRQGFFWSLWIEFLKKRNVSLRKAETVHASEFIFEFARTRGEKRQSRPSRAQVKELMAGLIDIYEVALIPAEVAAENPFKAR